MSKFRCVCGHVLSTSGEIPNPDEWLFMSDMEFSEFQGVVDAEALYHRFGRAYVCPISGHLWVFRHAGDEIPKGYAPVSAPDPGDTG